MLVNMLSAAEPSLAGLSVSTREVVPALKKRGEARASEIAAALRITPSGVRQHLSAFGPTGSSLTARFTPARGGPSSRTS